MKQDRGVWFYFILFWAAETMVAVGICLGLYLTSGMNAFLTACLIAGPTLVFSFIFLLVLRGKLTTFSMRICQTIDRMMEGHQQPAILLEDTLLDKIGHRLLRLYEVLQESRSQTFQEHEALQQLISDISHQLKTPIANIGIINATLLDREVPQEKKEAFLISQQAQLHKLEFLIEALIKTSRMESGVIRLVPGPYPISETIAQALGGIIFDAEKKQMEVEIYCGDAILVRHDPKWTGEALYNILDNAVKYTEAAGRITVTVTQGEIYTKIDVADTGKGIPESRFGQIFQRFYREPESGNLPGVGLGLYLAREIILRQDGYIVVASQPHEGATFSIFLPSHKTPSADAVNQNESE